MSGCLNGEATRNITAIINLLSTMFQQNNVINNKASFILSLFLSQELSKVLYMDKELLARKLYVERVNALVGDHEVDESVLTEMWESKASPSDAAKAILSDDNGFDGPTWLSRYLNRR